MIYKAHGWMTQILQKALKFHRIENMCSTTLVNDLSILQQKVDDNSHRLLPFLLFARMFPISPSWLLNIVAPFLNIPLLFSPFRH
uniref:Uncharacterized protein n=1 Tax=Ditylenchus dipsaci TaxID=166011 RepID=A0A915D143_9BILA